MGDRLTLVSDGILDFFNLGQEEVTFGAYLDRPPRGSLYVGVGCWTAPSPTAYLHVLQLPDESQVALLLQPQLRHGQHQEHGGLLRITRIGESLLVSGGFTYDPAPNSVGAVFSVEPRPLPNGRLGQVGGTSFPPPAPSDWNDPVKGRVP